MTKLVRAFLLYTLLFTVFAAPSQAEVKEWRIDPVHSFVGFKVRHMMVSWVRGRFNKYEGKVWHDPADPTKTKVELQIDAASIDTGNERRDAHLRNPDFFDVEKFPHLRFVSKKITGNATTGFKVTGDLTLHGVTKEVVLDSTDLSAPVADGKGGEKSGVTVSGKINRSDFGVTWHEILEAGGVNVGDEIFLEIEAELARGGPAAPAKKSGT
jgi:polyisoprenoid-binding protein YceI